MTALPPVRVEHPHVEILPDIQGGSPLIRGYRVPVRRLWSWFQRGVTVETLISVPSLGPAAVLDALAFCFDNPELLAADSRAGAGTTRRPAPA